MIPGFDSRERRIVDAAMIYRYGEPIPLEEADVELKLDPASDALTPCPAYYWKEHGVQFVVCKTGEKRYRSYFFHLDNEQYRIGEQDYEHLEDCARNLLQLQSDHQALRRGILSGSTGKDLKDGTDDYLGHWLI